MKVYPIVPRGYCKGVVRAIAIAKKCATEYPNEKISILGMIVHNKYIVDALEDLGIHTIDIKGKTRLELLDEIDEGIVIITAHGAGSDVTQKAIDKGLKVIDATCVDVIKTHDLIKEAILNQKDVLYIGKKGHPEAEGTLAINPTHIHLITSTSDIDSLDQQKSYLITNQTTMSMFDIAEIFNYAKQHLQNVEVAKETCRATQVRQEALMNLPEDLDGVIIVGDPHSNNTTRLASIAKSKANIDTLMIETIQDLDEQWLKNKSHVGVSSGASTPTYLTNQVIDYLKNYDNNKQKPVIDLNKILS